jgi:hypothetical protein
MTFKRKVKSRYKLKEYVRILNSIFELSDRECQIFATLLEMDLNWVPKVQTDIKNITSTEHRRAIMRETRLNKSNLSTYITALKNKRILVETSPDDTWEVNRNLIPSFAEDGSMVINFIIEPINNEDNDKRTI